MTLQDLGVTVHLPQAWGRDWQHAQVGFTFLGVRGSVLIAQEDFERANVIILHRVMAIWRRKMASGDPQARALKAKLAVVMEHEFGQA